MNLNLKYNNLPKNIRNEQNYITFVKLLATTTSGNSYKLTSSLNDNTIHMLL